MLVVAEKAEKKNASPIAGDPVQPMLEINSEEARRRRARNYSFTEKLSDPLKAKKFDLADVPGIGEVSIPATMGSTYWAILKVCYERANEPIYPDVLVKAVEELLSDAFPERWDIYTGKAETTVFRRVNQKRDRQKIKPWQERLINNAKTLTRVGGTARYGLRLKERGHILRFEYDTNKKPCFILHTNLDCIKKKPVISK